MADICGGPLASAAHRRLIAAIAAALATVVMLATPALGRAAAGDLDPTFGSGGIALTPVGSGGDGATGLVREADGSFAAVGSGMDSGGAFVPEVAHYTTAGALDTGFGSHGLAALPTHNGDILFHPVIALQASTGDLVVAGTWESPSNVYVPGDFGMVRLKPDGSLDTSFGSSGIVDSQIGSSGDVLSIAVDPTSGTIFLGGDSQVSGSDNQLAVAAYTAGGQLEDGTGGAPAFGTGGSVITPVSGGGGQLIALALDGSTIVGAGDFSSSTAGSGVVMRYTAAGAPDPTFNGGSPAIVSLGTGAYSGASSVLVQSTHRIVVGGYGLFGSGSSVPSCQALTRLNADGSVDTGFGTGGIAHLCVDQDSSAYGIAQSADGSLIYAAGNAFDATNTNHTLLSRWTADGAPDTSFGTGGEVLMDAAPGAGNSSLANAVVMDGANPVLGGQAYNGASTTTYYALERMLGGGGSGGGGGGGVGSRPANTSAPTVTPADAARPGTTLTATVGTWTGAGSYAYQWLNCTSACQPIPGATSATLVAEPTAPTRFAVEVTASNAAGSTVSPVSNEVLVSPPPQDSTAPSITPAGPVPAGTSLTADVGGWSGGVNHFAYQWYRCATAGSCAAVPGATGGTFTTTPADASLSAGIEVIITATNDLFGSTSAPSTNHVVVQPATSDLALNFLPRFLSRMPWEPWTPAQYEYWRGSHLLRFWTVSQAEAMLSDLWAGMSFHNQTLHAYVNPVAEGLTYAVAREDLVAGCEKLAATKQCEARRLHLLKPDDIVEQNPDPVAGSFHGSSNQPKTLRLYYWNPALDPPSPTRTTTIRSQGKALPDILDLPVAQAEARVARAGIYATYVKRSAFGNDRNRRIDDVVAWSFRGDRRHVVSSPLHPVTITLDLYEGTHQVKVRRCDTGWSNFDALIRGLKGQDEADAVNALKTYGCVVAIQETKDANVTVPRVVAVTPTGPGDVTLGIVAPKPANQDLFLIVRPSTSGTPETTTLGVTDWAVPVSPSPGMYGSDTAIAVQVIDRAGRLVRNATVTLSGAVGRDLTAITDRNGEAHFLFQATQPGTINLMASAGANLPGGGIYGFAKLNATREGSAFATVPGQTFTTGNGAYVCQLGPRNNTTGAGCVDSWLGPQTYTGGTMPSACDYNTTAYGQEGAFDGLVSGLQATLSWNATASHILSYNGCPAIDRMRLLVTGASVFPAQIVLAGSQPLSARPGEVKWQSDAALWGIKHGRIVDYLGWAARLGGNDLAAAATGLFSIQSGWGGATGRQDDTVNAAHARIIRHDNSAVLDDGHDVPPAAGGQDAFALY